MQTLNDYGFTFQIKIVSALLTDREFAATLYDSYEPQYFEAESVQWIVKKYFEYFLKYKDVPSLDYFKIECLKLSEEGFKSEVVNNLRLAWQHTHANDLAHVMDATLEFCVNQALKGAILESVDLLERGQFDDIKSKIDKALQKGRKINTGTNYKEDIDKRYTEEIRFPCTTGWPVIDDLTGGGLAGGNLGVIIAPSGVGKTWVLCHLGAAAAAAGVNVLHYSLELNEDYVGKRYDAILTGLAMSTLPDNLPLVKSRVEKLRGNVHIFHRSPRKLSVVGLEAEIQRLKLAGAEPGLVIIDYADLMKVSGNFSRDDKALQALYEDLRSLSTEFNIPFWTASQTNREGLKDNVVEADSVSDSYGKVFTADFIMSVSRKLHDKANNTARVHVIKNRLGSDGLTFPTTFSTSTGAIQIHDERTDRGQEAAQVMQLEHAYLKNRYSEFFDKNPEQKNLQGLL